MTKKNKKRGYPHLSKDTVWYHKLYMNDKKVVWAWVGAGVVVIAIIIGVVWHPGANNSANGNPVPVFAPQGQLTPKFPQQLILHFLNGVTGSYSVGAGTSGNQYTAELNSSSSISFIYNQYLEYLLSNGWKITNTKNTQTSSGIYASTSTADVSIAAVTQGGGSHVIISYLAKNN